MALGQIFAIAGSALSAESVRLNTVSSNLANAETVSGTSDQAYRAREPVFASMLAQQVAGQKPESVGVRVVDVVESAAPPRMEYRPDHPLADENGNVFVSNVNTMEQLADLISASRSYQTNVEVLNTSKQLYLKTLELGG
ncbi:MAG: flagellar basal body rod protein FlgC [Chromatiaceae bacterium]